MFFLEDGVPCISPVRKNHERAGSSLSNQARNNQSVLGMNVKLWQEAIKVLNIKEAMIPKVANQNKRST